MQKKWGVGTHSLIIILLSKVNKIFENINTAKCFIFALSFLANFTTQFFMKYPIITDEYVTICEGIYSATGFNFNNSFYSLPTGYYGVGLSILAGPLFYLTHNMQIIYHSILVINSILISLIGVIAFDISSRYLCLSLKKSAALGTLVVFSPAYFFYSKYAINEVMLYFISWLIIYFLLHVFSDNISIKYYILYGLGIGFFSVYAYFVHGRGIVIFVASYFALFYIAINNRKKRWGKKQYHLWPLIIIAAVILSCVTYAMNDILKIRIISHFFGLNSGEIANTSENIVKKLLSLKKINAIELRQIFQGVLGQLFYICMSSFGLVLVSIISQIKFFCNYKRNNNDKINKNKLLLSTYFIIISITTFLISIVFFGDVYASDSAIRGEYYLYGRYNELFITPVVYIAMLFAIDNRTEFCKSLKLSLDNM